jgi:rubrerythrin/uncharacterized membrane protein
MTPDHFHPLSVHFPIAIILIGFLFELFSLIFSKEHNLSKAGFYLMLLGTLAAVASYFTGEFFTKELIGPTGELKEKHEFFAKTTMWIMVGVTVIRIILMMIKKEKTAWKWLVFVLLFAASGTVAYTGYLGGSLVYDYMLLGSANIDNTKDTTQTVTMKTIDNLKTAIKGETTASEKYSAYAKKAREENLIPIAILFEASSAAEKVHLKNLTESLNNMGGKMEDFKPEFIVKSTIENLQDAISGEKNENEVIYPGFIKDAETDKADDAGMAFEYAMDVEKIHMNLFVAALDALNAKKVNTLPVSYSVCPRCGLTYDTKKLPETCEVCGTAKDQFTTYK